jgi:hypothetical protein
LFDCFTGYLNKALEKDEEVEEIFDLEENRFD